MRKKIGAGDKVVCKYPKRSFSCPNPLVKGEIYTVAGIYVCQCSSVQICLEEADYDISMICKCGREEWRRQSYYAWRFQPLQYYNTYNEVFKSKKELGEKEDIPEFKPDKVKTN